MRQYERSGVHVDQCSECRGIFLDRGELEKLIDAETSFHAATPPPAAPAAPPPADRYQQRGRDSYGSHGYQYPTSGAPYGSHGYGHRKKRKSFLEELFD